MVDIMQILVNHNWPILFKDYSKKMHEAKLSNRFILPTYSFWCIISIPPLWRKSCCPGAANNMCHALETDWNLLLIQFLQNFEILKIYQVRNKKYGGRGVVGGEQGNNASKACTSNIEGSRSKGFLVSPLIT